MIQEEDAKYLGRHGLKTPNPQPLYDENTGKASMGLFESVAFRQPFQISDIQVMLQPAGRILGAASVIEAEGKKSLFPVISVVRRTSRYPLALPEVDLLFKSTVTACMKKPGVLNSSPRWLMNARRQRGGDDPGISVGRAANQHLLVKLMDEGRMPGNP